MKERSTHLKGSLLMLFLCGLINSNGVQAQNAQTQAVTEIVTDYNGFWRSGSTDINPIKPQNSHNLLSFNFNGVRYSTGVNDQLLTDNGLVFSAQDFYALDMQYYTGAKVPDTYIGLGQLYDGVDNGPSVPPPYNNIPYYLMDGIHGLDIGTCVANLPVGYIVFGVNGIDPAAIGDGIPDILITQIAQPSNATDQYAFRDAAGNIVGNSINIQLQNIQPVGNWVADFYRAMNDPMVIPAGFVNTERPLRLWAADLADFGITAADIDVIQSFSIRLAGTTDIAFIAYNYNTANLTPLPGGLALEKEGVFIDENGNCMPDVGERIEYTFRVYNTGDTPIFNIQVEDNLVDVIGDPIDLLGGASNIDNFHATYYITADDIDRCVVYNSAVATGMDQNGNIVTTNSIDPTPIPVNSPYFDAGNETATVVVLPCASVDATIPDRDYELCSVNDIINMPYSATPVNITRTQFTSAGGTITAYMPITSITYVDEIIQDSCPIIIERTFNLVTCKDNFVTQTITLHDTTAPTVQPIPALTLQACNVEFPAPDASVVQATDNCSEVNIAFVNDSEVTYNGCGESIVRTYKVTDACGNETLATQTITRVMDAVNPTVSNLADIFVNEINAPFPAPNTALVNAYDNCGVPTVAFVGDADPVANGCQESIVRTYSVADVCGNTVLVTQNLIRTVDYEAPIAPELAAVDAPCAVTLTAPQAQDACSGTITATTTDPITYTQQGTYTVTWTFTDAAGNSSTATQTVNIQNDLVPSAPVLNAVNGQCSAEVTAPTYWNGCTNETITATTTDPLNYTNPGNYTITWTFDLGEGIVLTSTQQVNVVDTVAPVVPQIETVVADCTATVTAPVAQDECSGAAMGYTTDPTEFNTPGIYNITWMFADAAGNISSATQTVVINAPAVEMPVLENVVANCSAMLTPPTVLDPCTGANIVASTTSPLVYDQQGTFTVTWNFLVYGQTYTTTQQVIIEDTVAPEVPVLDTVTGLCSATLTAPTATDNCSGEITGTTSDPLTYNEQGTYTVTWTFTDAAGNASTATQTVVIENNGEPTLPTLETVTADCQVTVAAPSVNNPCTGEEVVAITTDPTTYTTAGEYAITWTFIVNNQAYTATQNVVVIAAEFVAPVLEDVTAACSITVEAPTAVHPCTNEVITATTTDEVAYATPGVYTINWVFDVDGETFTVAQTAMVTAAEFVAPVLADLSGECTVVVEVPVALDTCTNTEIAATTTDDLEYYIVGNYTINWVFEVNGENFTVTQNVVVTDNTAPVAPVMNTLTASCYLAVTEVPVAMDNCSGEITGTTTSELVFDQQGTYEIVWTFTDAAGNTSTATQTVILDNQAPTDLTAYVACNDDEFHVENLNSYLPEGVPTDGTWVDLANTGALSGASFTAYGLEVGTYTFEYEVQQSNCPLVYTLSIEVDNDCVVLPACTISIHNAVTPNNDGVNDFFFIDGLTDGCFTSNTVEIYNRWGVLVYEARNYDNNTVKFYGQSEGRSTVKKGEDLPAGTYFYILRYTDTEGKAYEKSSYLYLSR